MGERAKVFDDVWVRTKHGSMHFFVGRNGNNIESGAKSPVGRQQIVLIHGLVVSATYMEPTARELAARHDVYVPDMLGHGQSSTPQRALTVNEHVECLAFALAQLGVREPLIVGGSCGCNLAVELALKPAVHAKAVALIGPSDVRGKSRMELIGKLVNDGKFEPPVMVPLVINDILRIGIDRCLAQLEYMAEHDYYQRLNQIDVPVLLIRGQNDELSSEDTIDKSALAASHSQEVGIIDAAHALPFAEPELMGDLIENFMRHNFGDRDRFGRAA